MALESGDHEFTFIFGVRSHRDNVFKRKYITRVIKRVEIHLCRFVALRSVGDVILNPFVQSKYECRRFECVLRLQKTFHIY